MAPQLVFAFIKKKFRSLENVGINFSPFLNIDYDWVKHVLKIDPTPLSTDFFPKNITGITAIVGKNGTGKSTILQWLGERIIPGLAASKLDGIIIEEMPDNQKTKLIVWSDVEIKDIENNSNIVIEIRNSTPGKAINLSLGIPMIFSSGHFDIPHPDSPFDNEWMGMINISDKLLLVEDLKNYSGQDAIRGLSPLNDYINAYSIQNQLRISRLIMDPIFHALDGKKGVAEVNFPKYIGFSANIAAHNNIESKFKSISDRLRQDDKTISKEQYNYWKDLNNFAHNREFDEIEGKDDKALLAEILYCSLRSFFYNFGIPTTGVPFSERLNLLKLVKEDYSNFNGGTYSWCNHIIDKIEREYTGVFREDNKEISFRNLYTEFFLQLKCVIEFMRKELSWKEGVPYIEVSAENSADVFKQVEILMESNIFLTGRFFNLSFSHYPPLNGNIVHIQLSSGELGLLNLFSRIKSAWNQDMPGNNTLRPALIILDEVEMSFHPEWQRRFISRLLSFMRLLASREHKAQIIYTTHSPITLSDMPKECVNMLDRKEGATIVVSAREKQQTFGANVFDIYGDSFFMENGLIGEFALEKIKSLSKDVEGFVTSKHRRNENDNVRVKSALLNRLNIIGDRRIKSYLMSRLDISPKDLEIEMLKREIAELKARK